jgi:putative tryptophan/tyrosine transport system substrate-binding protein
MSTFGVRITCTFSRHSLDDSEISVDLSDFAASLEARAEMWMATASSGTPVSVSAYRAALLNASSGECGIRCPVTIRCPTTGDGPMSFRLAILVAGLLAAFDLTNGAAQTEPVMGYVAAKNANPKRLEVFKQGLTDSGYVDGKNIRIEYREAVLDAEYHDVMTELVNRKVDIILAANVAATVAAAKATNAIPVVMLAVFDPVGVGVVKSLERPGTNVTGTTMYAPQLIGERVRILARIVPNLDKVAMVFNGNNANNAAQLELLRSEARKLGVEVQPLDIRKPEDVDAAFDKARAFGAKALVNAVDSFINSRRFALAAGAAKHRLPVVYTDVEYVLAGGLMALGPGHYEGYYGAAKYVDQILRGANPADLPIAGPTQFTMSANRTTLAKLGLSLPADLSARVDEWID